MRRPSSLLVVALLVAGTAPHADAAVDAKFQRAVQYGSVADVQAAIDRNVDLTQRDDQGNTPLHWAAQSQSAAKVKALLSAGADLNARNYRRETPLHRCFWEDKRYAPAIDALLDAPGLELDVMDDRGRTSLDLASQSPELKWAGELLKMGAKDSLHAAAARGDAAAVGRLLMGGAEVDATGLDGMTPLLWAARHGRVEVIRLLVGGGAKLDAGDGVEGRTPLIEAACAGEVVARDALLELGADPNVIDRFGRTVVDCPTLRGGDRIGFAREVASGFAQRILEHPRAKPPLRAAALLRQGYVAGGGPDGPALDVKRAETLYRKAAAEAPTSPSGIRATGALAQVLKEQERYAAVVETLLPLIVEDVTGPGIRGRIGVVSRPEPDCRHYACIEIADACLKLNRHPDALKYARLARDKYTYQSHCFTGVEEHLKSVNERVAKLEKMLGVVPTVPPEE